MVVSQYPGCLVCFLTWEAGCHQNWQRADLWRRNCVKIAEDLVFVHTLCARFFSVRMGCWPQYLFPYTTRFETRGKVFTGI